MKIGTYIGSWPQNIGNAFFDFGARAILEKAIPDAEFYPIGGAVHWMFKTSESKLRTPLERGFRKLIGSEIVNNNSFEIGQFAELDLIVFAGMCLSEEFINNNGKTIIEASKRGVPILALGAGGSEYNEKESIEIIKFFKLLGKSAIITRDDITYYKYNGKIENIESGIDCAFFLPDYYNPPKLIIKNYDVENFDSRKKIASINHEGREIFYTHHDMWGILPKRYINKKNTIVSDVPEDYLTLYSQANSTYSDRVHACIATLAYGNKARLFSDTPRKALFAKFGLEKIDQELVSINKNILIELKNQQIEKTKRIITKMMDC